MWLVGGPVCVEVRLVTDCSSFVSEKKWQRSSAVIEVVGGGWKGDRGEN